ncbi:putative leucine-rich repeat-containing protein DDB_G0290503 [Harpegnathos saltator]|uniref:putative leucine-rich repeat-containing protein DDB_G0290503 n=1 Tax=Harpegnathos saltator TaxID=610380 RepID=UPI00058D7E90|nr:putative leucine-rich repeat-containing protein DDB_G0290503 [Harpegnathos saltator]XP_025160007.1 putative leucine-rich repeat-containing protein DDB_G0290503 [Harpegnathos saltator]XP_025160008.1 putative leucine-rich repeat-containing protein DDB_G0290503 [Harpegnathos saltator]XP_025160009.1 putative leucine-rich repeat-containing protein DDB_G0290503 [Harpegnathos saltator]XP_025160010.1 putative leucine-rich repeat-containing protein DDB_G0290503 [Harpegnathos saltator]
MPGCAAVGCNNRSEKGYRMKCFPRDPKLRKIWQERVARANWEPSNNSFLCDIHFESDKWCIMDNDDNIETINIVNICNTEKQVVDGENEKPVSDSISNLADNLNEDLSKSQVKDEAEEISVRPYNYDEIEEKLKQICDGPFEENNSNSTEKPYSISDDEKKVLQQTSNRIPIHKSKNYKLFSKSDIRHILTNDTEDIEVIFSTENREENAEVHGCASHNNDVVDDIEKLDSHEIDIDCVSNDKEIEQNINVTPNIMAAMKRKRITRNEIMKSIEKSICNASSQDTNSISDSDGIFDDDAEGGNEKRKKQRIQNKNTIDASPATPKFTVKVTGHPDDVSDIMYNLSKSVGDTNTQRYNDDHTPKEGDGFITSVITIDDCPADVDDEDESQDDDSLSACAKNITTKYNDRKLPSTSENSLCLSTVTAHVDEKSHNLNTNNSRLIPVVKNIIRLPADDCSLKHKYEKLQQKSKMQANAVEQLSNQLIFCKRVGQGLQNKNSVFQKKIQSLMNELNALTNNLSSSTKRMKENVDLKQKLTDDLSSRLSYLEESNKKLVKSMAVGNERVKKLESQVKQRDNRIKELNWKLEKASKYLERAEKNTNTYRRKMLNMQTFLKRKKLMDDKITRLNEILVNVVKESYSGKVLPMNVALEIKKTCGTTGYDKLLSSRLPLPTLSAVRIANDNLSDSNESINEILRIVPLRGSTNDIFDKQCTINNIEVDSENVESISREIVIDNTETIMGTVQDIFEESNDDDDFSTNELTEHFLSQLSTLM